MEFGWITDKIIIKALENIDCILCAESAADYLGLSNGVPTDTINVYSKEEIDNDGISTTIVSDYSSIEYNTDSNGIKHTTINQTIIDILRLDRDLETILSSLANYYFKNGETFEELKRAIPEDVKETFEKYKNDAIQYYDE